MNERRGHKQVASPSTFYSSLEKVIITTTNQPAGTQQLTHSQTGAHRYWTQRGLDSSTQPSVIQNAGSASGHSLLVVRWIWIRTQRASPLSHADRLHSEAHKGAQMNRRPPGSSGVQWLNRRDMSVRTEDSITLCQRALQIVTELCLTGHVDREKCSDIFPLESNIPGKGHAGKWNKVIILFPLFP